MQPASMTQLSGEWVQIHVPSKYLKQSEASTVLGISVDTLRRWNCPRIFLGKASTGRARRVQYNLEEVRAWLRQTRSC